MSTWIALFTFNKALAQGVSNKHHQNETHCCDVPHDEVTAAKSNPNVRLMHVALLFYTLEYCSIIMVYTVLCSCIDTNILIGKKMMTIK